MEYLNCSAQELEKEYASLKKQYENEKGKGLSLNMARGKPGKEHSNDAADYKSRDTGYKDPHGRPRKVQSPSFLVVQSAQRSKQQSKRHNRRRCEQIPVKYEK